MTSRKLPEHKHHADTTSRSRENKSTITKRILLKGYDTNNAIIRIKSGLSKQLSPLIVILFPEKTYESAGYPENLSGLFESSESTGREKILHGSLDLLPVAGKTGKQCG